MFNGVVSFSLLLLCFAIPLFMCVRFADPSGTGDCRLAEDRGCLVSETATYLLLARLGIAMGFVNVLLAKSSVGT